jgi:hypothetical protein
MQERVVSRGVLTFLLFAMAEKVGIHDASGDSIFRDDFRPLLVGDLDFPTFSYQLRISQSLTHVFRLLLFIVAVVKTHPELFIYYTRLFRTLHISFCIAT